MANKSKRSRKFGLAGGKTGAKRKILYGQKNIKKYTYRVKSKVFPKSHVYKNKLTICKDRILKKYNLFKKSTNLRNHQLFVKQLSNIFTIKRVSTDKPFAFTISRISTLAKEGYHMINLGLLQDHINLITAHVAVCKLAQKMVSRGFSAICYETEVKTNGLSSVLMAKCQGCHQKFKFETSPQLLNNRNKSKHYDVNVRAVWGSMATGGGLAHLNESLATLNSPGMSQQTYTTIEQEIGNMWGEVVEEDLLKAGAEERKIAMEKGQFHEGVPCITVICDGGWSKRTHKHSYNALGGVAIIIGAETGKLLHIGIRNKYCYLCSYANSKGTLPTQHVCYKNWDESSQAMESNIILEGFLKAETLHGLRYTKIIADGDSSVFSKLQENVPVWGKAIEKIECANHMCKCFRSNLEKLVEENPLYKGKNKLSKRIRIRLTSAVRCAIRMRSQQNSKNSSKLLEHDIRNSVHHIFDSMMLRDISMLLDRIARKSTRLIGNHTTNLAESWMAIRAKFDGGKFYNRCNRGSWQSRCYGGCLRMNLGPKWSPAVWEKCTSSTAGRLFHQLYERHEKKLSSCKESKKTEESKRKRWKRKHEANKESTSKKAKREYGPDVLDSVPDILPTVLDQKKQNFLQKHVNLTPDKLKIIEKGTRQQNQSSVWQNERRKRLTSSNFGAIIKKDPSKPVKKLVHRLLYGNFKGNTYTRKGLQEEAMTVIEYQNHQKTNLNKIVRHHPTGLFISPEHPFLAASPDGKIVEEGGETGLIEIKNLLHNKPINLFEAVKTVSNFCLELDGNNLKLKRTHDYFYQVQGQLNITDFPWADFVVRTVNPYQIHIERIKIDKDFWLNIMLPKLHAFYHKALLPELAHPSNNTTRGIREPGQWMNA
ncbi:hypothetical protein KUTeg_009233 [Tegillarca granosa]|uniref:YqaJ viral recombinase domain-containing protein n=1 Tax=Tegillarca granosa TaxID=220873 RepID=A0ABQ9F7B6_TEGGR|nr:hypothetical protein KUTeg_009233 [Tegillarca granosa]